MYSHCVRDVDFARRGDCCALLKGAADADLTQDHIFVPMLTEIDPSCETLDVLREPEIAATLPQF